MLSCIGPSLCTGFLSIPYFPPIRLVKICVYTDVHLQYSDKLKEQSIVNFERNFEPLFFSPSPSSKHRLRQYLLEEWHLSPLYSSRECLPLNPLWRLVVAQRLTYTLYGVYGYGAVFLLFLALLD